MERMRRSHEEAARQGGETKIPGGDEARAQGNEETWSGCGAP
jgi:hypothetical protein